MGKRGGGGQQQPWEPSYGRSYSGRNPKWGYWPGAWPRQGKDSTPERKNNFPAYDAKWTQPDIVPIMERRSEAGQERRTSFLQQVQAAVNAARKQDNRVMKLQSDQEAKHLQWNNYKRDIQQAFEQPPFWRSRQGLPV